MCQNDDFSDSKPNNDLPLVAAAKYALQQNIDIKQQNDDLKTDIADMASNL